jgi:hypothetical protein
LAEAVVEVHQLDLEVETLVADLKETMVDHQDLTKVVVEEPEETVQDHLTEPVVTEQLYQAHLVMHPHLFLIQHLV